MPPRRPTLVLVAVVALVALVAACSSSESATPTTAAPKDHAPCGLLTASEITAALGLTVGEGAPARTRSKELGPSATCTWTTAGTGGAQRTALALAVHEWSDVPDATRTPGDVDLGDAASYVRWFCRKLADSAGGRGPEAENLLLNFRGSPGCSSGNSTLVAVPSTLVVLQVPTDPPSVAERRATQRLAESLQPRL